ncbi:TRAP transporter small permease [Virgibacillus oceani]
MKLQRLLTIILGNLTNILLIAFTVTIFFQVILRYLFGITIFWGEEFTRYSLVFLTFLGMALSTSEKTNIRITALIDMFPQYIRQWIEFTVNLLCISFVVIVSVYSYDYLLNNMDFNSISLKIPMTIIYSIFPISGLFIVYFMLLENINIVKNFKRKVN